MSGTRGWQIIVEVRAITTTLPGATSLPGVPPPARKAAGPSTCGANAARTSTRPVPTLVSGAGKPIK